MEEKTLPSLESLMLNITLICDDCKYLSQTLSGHGLMLVMSPCPRLSRIPLAAWILITCNDIPLCVCFAVIPGVERVFPRYDVCAVPSHKHLDPVIERSDTGLGRRALLDDLQRVSGATAQWAVLTGTLDATVWVHAVC